MTQKYIHNVATGEIQTIELTNEEQEIRNAEIAEYEARKIAAEEAKAAEEAAKQQAFNDAVAAAVAAVLAAQTPATTAEPTVEE